MNYKSIIPSWGPTQADQGNLVLPYLAGITILYVCIQMGGQGICPDV